MSHDDIVTEHARRGGVFDTLNSLFRDIEDGGSRAITEYMTIDDVTTDLGNRIQTVRNKLEPVIDEVVPNWSYSRDLDNDMGAVQLHLIQGTDPDSGNDDNDAVNTFRTAVDNATSPAYGGDAFNDPLADLMAWVGDSHGGIA